MQPPPVDGRRRGTALRRAALAAAAALLVAVALRLPVPAYVQRPGPVFALGEVVEVAGAPAPLRGDYLFTTVELTDADGIDVLRAAVDPDAHLVARAAVLGGRDEDAFVAEQADRFAAARDLAVGLGLDAAGSDLDPADVAITSEGVGGGSAALLIAVAVADLASADDLAAGRRVSGTGALEADGTVAPVGSVADKLRAAEDAGADVFLVPAAQEAEARAAATTAEVLPVEDVAGALAALRAG
jgi:PDZ domain-containing secreted protein